jgi:hypothetical protein
MLLSPWFSEEFDERIENLVVHILLVKAKLGKFSHRVHPKHIKKHCLAMERERKEIFIEF